MKLNDYCGNSRLCLILSEYQPVIQKSHIHQGNRMNTPCVFANTAIDSPSFIKIFLVWNAEVKLLLPEHTGTATQTPRTDLFLISTKLCKLESFKSLCDLMQMVRSLLEADFQVYMVCACLQTICRLLPLAKESSRHSFND